MSHLWENLISSASMTYLKKTKSYIHHLFFIFLYFEWNEMVDGVKTSNIYAICLLWIVFYSSERIYDYVLFNDCIPFITFFKHSQNKNFHVSSWTWVLPFCSMYSPFFWVLWFIYEWQGFIMLGPMSPSVRDKITLFTCKQLPFLFLCVLWGISPGTRTLGCIAKGEILLP
jgi:hypothetical protein